MSHLVESEDDESRTLYIGHKRSFTVSESRRSSDSGTPDKKSRLSHAGAQAVHDFMPMGGNFSNFNQVQLVDRGDHSGSDSGSSAISSANHPKRSRASPPIMNWNKGTSSIIRTSLRGDGPALGQNRLATAFSKPRTILTNNPRVDGSRASPRSSSDSQAGAGNSAEDAIEISDDTDMEDQSDEGGVMINLEDEGNNSSGLASEPIERSEGEIGEDEDPRLVQAAPSHSIPSRSGPSYNEHAHRQLQGDLERSLAVDRSTIPAPDLIHTSVRLADLNAEELEKQIKYTLFYLHRDQIDLNRRVVCTSCLQEGHLETSCDESNCTHCLARNAHSSRTCPTFRRCLKCRERGHDVDICTSKLKDSSVPCEHCGSAHHLENRCPTRFFPVRRPLGSGKIRMWIACCMCASKSHLVGDCPKIAPGRAMTWSLQSLDPNEVTNLSLEAGFKRMERDVENRGMRPEGLKIRGRANQYRSAQPLSDEEDEPFLRPRVRDDDNSQQRSHIRFDNRGYEPERRDLDRDRGYRGGPAPYQSQQGGYDKVEPQYSDLHDRPRTGGDNWYATDSFGQRRRSRSPDSDRYRPGAADGWRPPLPREPPPSRPPQSSRQRDERRIPRRMKKKGADTYKPMPRAAKNAWDKHRL